MDFFPINIQRAYQSSVSPRFRIHRLNQPRIENIIFNLQMGKADRMCCSMSSHIRDLGICRSGICWESWNPQWILRDDCTVVKFWGNQKLCADFRLYRGWGSIPITPMCLRVNCSSIYKSNQHI